MNMVTHLLIAFMLTLSSLGIHAQTQDEVKVGSLLRDTLLTGLNGRDRQLSEFKGRPLIINMWASWCGPCQTEMESLERLTWKPELNGVTIIGISTDDDKKAAQKFLTKNHATFNHFIDHDLSMKHMLGTKGIPFTIIIDSNGRVMDKVLGSKEWDSPEYVQRITQALRRSR